MLYDLPHTNTTYLIDRLALGPMASTIQSYPVIWPILDALQASKEASNRGEMTLAQSVLLENVYKQEGNSGKGGKPSV